MTPGREYRSLSSWAVQRILWGRKDEAIPFAALMLEEARGVQGQLPGNGLGCVPREGSLGSIRGAE